MSKYGSDTEEEAKQEFWRFAREIIFDTIIVVAIFAAGVLFITSFSGCSFNFASDRQPAVMIYADDTVGKCE